MKAKKSKNSLRRIAQLNKLETRFYLWIPKSYRRFFKNYPKELESVFVDLTWKREYPYERELRRSYRDLLHLNIDVRDGQPIWTKQNGVWPDYWFVIGDDQCGNYWAIDTRPGRESICFYDHDFGTYKRVARDIWKFKDQVKKKYGCKLIE